MCCDYQSVYLIVLIPKSKKPVLGFVIERDKKDQNKNQQEQDKKDQQNQNQQQQQQNKDEKQYTSLDIIKLFYLRNNHIGDVYKRQRFIFLN